MTQAARKAVGGALAPADAKGTDVPHPSAPKGSDVARKIAAALGSAPGTKEVRALFAAHSLHRLLSDGPGDIALVNSFGSALRAGNEAEAYSVLVDLRHRGPALDRALDAVVALFGPDVDVELRALAPAAKASWSFTWLTGSDRVSVLEWLRQHDGLRNLYVGVNPRKAHLRGTARASNEADVAMRRFVVFDHDNKDAPDSDPGWKAATRLMLGAKPQMQVASGNGIQTWFQIEEVSGEATITATTKPINDLLRAAGSDPVGDAPRVMRLPWTINIPNAAKRARGCSLALATVMHGPDPQVTVWQWPDLAVYVQRVLGLDLTASLSATALGASGGGDALPADMLRAPNSDLLVAALDLLPNDANTERQFQVDLAHAVRGASAGTPFEAEAKDAFLRWSDKFPTADTDADERVYDTIRSTKRGWPHIVGALRTTNPSGYRMILDREAPLRVAAAGHAFADTPVSDDQKFLISLPANDNHDADHADRAVAALAASDAAPDAKAARRSVAQNAVEALRRAGAEFFQSPNARAWIVLAGRIYRIDSEAGFRAVVSWLTVHTDLSITGSAKADLKELLLNRAFVGEQHPVHYRQTQDAAPANPVAFVNMMDGHGNGICVDGKGWRVFPTAAMPVRFTDRTGGRAMPQPVRPNDGVSMFDRLGRHVPLQPVQTQVDPEDAGTQQRAGLLMFLLNQFFRAGSAVHLSVHAPQGSGKTMATLRLKDLLDPDEAPLVPSLPSDEAMLFSIAQQQPLLGLDNLSSMKGDVADLFCGLATGTFQQKRGLYTNDDRVIYGAKTSLMFGSIREDLIQRPDLLDRTVVMDLPPLGPKGRKTEQDLNAAWEHDKPRLLADVLDTLAGGLALLQVVRAITPPEALPRLTDAALLAEAAAQGLGWKPGLCLAAIKASRRGANERQLEENPYTARVREMLNAEGGTWTGTVAELRDKLQFVDGPEWGTAGRSIQAFTSAVNRMESPLAEAWNIRTSRTRSRGVRRVKFDRVP